MSKNLELSEIEKYITSRLWYTTSIVLTTEVGNHLTNYTKDDIDSLQELINTALGISEHRQQCEWISYKLLLPLDKHSATRTKEKLDLIQFHFNLKLIDNKIPELIEKELIELFATILGVKQGDIFCSNSITTGSYDFLEYGLYTKPALTCWLINDLLRIWPVTFFSSDLILQDLYSNTLKLLLQKDSNNEQLGALLCILSKLNITESKEDELLSWLYLDLYKKYNSDIIELALYSRKNIKFIKEWHKFLDVENFRSMSIDNFECTKKICKTIFYTNSNNLNGIEFQAKELTLRIIKQGVHWLLDIMDICSVLVENKEYDETFTIMSHPILRNFWSALLLYFLNNLSQIQITTEEDTWQKNIDICESLKYLSNKSYYSLYEYDEPILVNLNLWLKSQLTIIKWILKYRKKYLHTTAEQNLSVKGILNRLQNHCILTVLKTSIDIHECNYTEIENLLKDKEDLVRIYKSYKAMQTALKIILTSELFNVQDSVTDYCIELEFLVNAITPLSMRLEVIENIFSMIFLHSNEHFNNTEGIFEEEDYDTTISDKDKYISINKDKDFVMHKRHGFICNKNSVKKLLDCLKRCIGQLSIDFAKLKQEINNIKDLEVLQKNILTLDNILTDAFWRFELLLSPDFENKDDIVDNSRIYLNDSEIAVDEKSNFSYRMKSKSIFYNQQTESSSEEDERDFKSDLEISSETGSTDTNNVNNKRKKKFKNYTSTMLVGGFFKTSNSKFIINLMLSSRESLVLQCLWKRDYGKAQQVIEMFNMKNTQLDGQVRFSKAIQNFRLDIMKQTSSSNSIDFDIKHEELKILENVRRAAHGGYKNSRIASQVETFIASQELNARLISMETMTAREILILCVLDFTLTLDQSPHTFSSLVDVALRYLKLSRKLEATRHGEHFMDVYRLVQENDLVQSIPKALCNAMIPLKVYNWTEKIHFWRELSDKIKQFQTIQFSNKLDDSINDNMNLSKKILHEIIVLCENNQSYLQIMLEYLQILYSIVPNAKTESALLSNSLDSYFGHQIFNLNVEPENLEEIANKIGVNLVHNILINCCPKLTCRDSLPTINREMWGCIVLNKNYNNNKIIIGHKSQDPNQCIADILLELLQAIKRLYPDCSRILNKNLEHLSGNIEIQQILSKSSILETLDLSELSVGDHTLAFFLNLWNLLFLHAQLTVWAINPPLNTLRRFIALSSINYHVGDLGRISLLTLRSKLLGSMSWDAKYFSSTEDLNEVVWQDLDLIHDPRVIFAMINEFFETPAIRIYNSQTLNADLNQNICDYLNFYSKKQSKLNGSNHEKLKEGEKIILISDLVKRYDEFVEKNVLNNNVSHNQFSQKIFSTHDYLNKSEQFIFNYTQVTNIFDILVTYKECDSNINLILKKNKNSNYNLSWISRPIKSNVLHYLEGHCWLLSYLVKRIHKESSTVVESSCDNLQRTTCFKNNSSAPWIFNLATALLDSNITLASIQENLSLNDLWIYFEKCLKNNQIQNCLDIINALPNKLLIKCTEIQCLKDKLLYQLIYIIENSSNTEKILQYIYQIRDVNVLAQAILSNINKWPVLLCKTALFHVLHHSDKHKLPLHCRFKMNETLCRVTVFNKMLPYCKDKEISTRNATWYDVVYCTEKTDPVYIIQSLIEADKFELCLEWLEYQTFSLEIQSLITQDLFVGLLKNDETDFKNAHKLLMALPKRQSIKMCKGVLKQLESIKALRFVIEYLLEHCESQKTIAYCKIQIGIEILDQLESNERVYYIQLIKEPLLMLEQLLMNCKFENLRRIMNAIQHSNNLQKADISIESFDKLVRFYAGKSLDFRISFQRDGMDLKGKDSITPIVTLDNENQNDDFIMPINVPSKEEWIPNDKARECSCCKAVIFSMFNRRHHCRRCGRVVCASCSQQRMQVTGYPKSVLVRICDDCKKQTILQMQTAHQGTSSTASSIALECWSLTTDETHNQTVREEFSFEYAPNISLCLAILSLHSDHKAYASFLLDRCDEMKRLLQPVPDGLVNPEIDHALIIKMIRSLLVAVKVKCAKLSLNAGLAHCDRFLSQVDLIATLVQSDCLALIPTDDSLDDHALRKLRDLLTEKEQWTLALDVSTKAGLDTQGVWAAWGKACLKVGYLDRARTKFTHCLEKILFENFDDWVFLSYPDSEYTSKSSEDSTEIQKQRKFDETKIESPNRKHQSLKSRPIKDPPLLLEILQILDNQNQLNLGHSQNFLQSKPNSAQEILTTLNSLKAVSQGQYSFIYNFNSNNIYQEESLYYLLTYGSSNSILEFFLKCEEFNKCLTFILENNIDPELFFNSVYLRCLNMGKIEKLLEAMKINDTSLLTWKKYLVYTCHSLDKKQFLHTLYHLQLFMKDHIRAAMTCIHFYTNDTRNYVDLFSRSHFLVEAQKHLESELNVENLSKRRRKSINSSHSGSHGNLTMEMEPSEIDKHINTISRQLEIAKFLNSAEKEGRSVAPYLKYLLDMNTENIQSEELPTLFGNQQQKTRLAVLAILCGRDTEEGFGIAFRILQDYNLRPQKVYSLAGHILALEKKINSIEQLIKCCQNSGAPDSQVISDRVLTHCVRLLLHNLRTESNSIFKDRVDSLIRLINDVELKISSYIESKQLKAAYLLAVKYQRAQDIRKILKEADKLGQNAIRSICIKWLKQSQNSL